MASKFSKRKADETGVQTSESEISKLRKENAYLKKALEDLARQKGEPSDSENNKMLLERILALETLREKNSQQILSRDQDIACLRQQLQSDSADVVAALQAQLNQQKLEAEKRERLYQSLKQETEEVKNKLAAVSAKCQELENREDPQTMVPDGQSSTGNAAVIQEHLKDALEKNQQWLVYDQQREEYVKMVLSRTYHLEQQLKTLQQKHKKTNSEATEMQHHYQELLAKLEAEQECEARGRRQVSQLQRQCEDQQLELSRLRQKLQAEQSTRKDLQEQKRSSGEHIHHLQAELEEEKLRSAELLQQVNLLQKSLLNHQEEKKQMKVMEQQIQASANDLEDEKRDNQHLQRQLHKVLKELRKAKDRMLRLESEKTQTEAPSSELDVFTKLQKASKESQQSFTSPTRAHSLLDESFLECPNCRAQYPTSHHRELLLHIDHCLD